MKQKWEYEYVGQSAFSTVYCSGMLLLWWWRNMMSKWSGLRHIALYLIDFLTLWYPVSVN